MNDDSKKGSLFVKKRGKEMLADGSEIHDRGEPLQQNQRSLSS
jgi:hypothetical protein